VRLPGLEARSPARIVLDREARLSPSSKLARSAHAVPVLVAACQEADPARKAALEAQGVKFLAAEAFDGRIALPELLEDLAAQGMSSVMVEGGAHTARAFLDDELVDRIVLFRGPGAIGPEGIDAPLSFETVPAGFRLVREARYGDDFCAEWARDI
jgi:diaminohydroxyphosphoribosylaminopyrimidine deaminase/5-amino-6-(5-phosphoribosylamino)uracil reductase